MIIPTTKSPEMVWDMLYADDRKGKTLKAVEFYFSHLYKKNISKQLKQSLIRTWIKTYGIRVVRKAIGIIKEL